MLDEKSHANARATSTMALAYRAAALLLMCRAEAQRIIRRNVGGGTIGTESLERSAPLSAAIHTHRRVACLDTSRAFSGATDTAIPDRKSKPWRGSGAVAPESSGCLLHNLVSPAALGLFHFGFRARIFFLLVCQDFWIIARDGLVSPPARGPQSRARFIRRTLDFSLLAVVAVVAGHAARNDRDLGNMHGLRDPILYTNQHLASRDRLHRIRVLRR